MYLARPVAPGSSTRLGVFQKVCSPSDLATYPAGQPYDAADPPFFRAATFTGDFSNRADAIECHDLIVQDVRSLLQALAYMDRQTALTPITITVGA